MIKENKVSKYLLYAIGEIVLVVIGILIALSINNWNEGKKAEVKEQFALLEIISDLDLNITSLNKIIYTDDNSINNCMNSLKIIINNVEHTKVYHDSLAKHFRLTFRFPEIDTKSSGYESLTSIGMDLISNSELRSEIGKYFSYSIPQGRASYIELRDDFYHYMLDFVRTEFIAVGTEYETQYIYPADYELLLKNREYKESLKTYIAVFDQYLERSLSLLDQSKELKLKIELKLNDHD
jgi:uncharacterized membrane protein YgaE (UPF0421/DUF939 family)